MWYDLTMIILGTVSIAGIIWSSRRMHQAAKAGKVKVGRKR